MFDGCISDLLAKAAQRYGRAPALRMLDDTISRSFLDLDAKAASFASGLLSIGVSRGDRVVLHLPNSEEWIVSYHAVARLGGVVVPANILLTPGEVGFLANDSEAVAVVLPADRYDAVRSAIGGSQMAGFVVVGGEARGGHLFGNLLEGPGLLPAEMLPDDLLAIAYTSGTTGKPKGAQLTHRNVFASTVLTATTHVRTFGERVLTALPFSHVYGNIVMNAAILVGMELQAMARFDAGRALSAISSDRPSLFEGVPTMFYQMLSHPDLHTTDFSSLTRVTVGGQTMPSAKLDEIAERFGCPICELWGMTEVAGPAVSHSPYWPSRHGTIGLPFTGVEIRIANLDRSDRIVSAGEAGELWIRGPLVTKGYWRNTQATNEAIDADGWLATGDIAIQEHDGYLRIVDRRNDLIITGGYNIYPAELEQVIASHPSVSMVAVAGVSDTEKGELAKAFIVLRPGHDADLEGLKAHCRTHLAAYKVPRIFAFVEDLPRNSTGKIMRRSLQEH